MNNVLTSAENASNASNIVSKVANPAQLQEPIASTEVIRAASSIPSNTSTEQEQEQLITGATPTPYTNSIGVAEELAKLGEKLGEFKAYDSQLPIAEITGTRIVKCLYQVSPKTGKKLRENSYVRVPTKHLTEEHVISSIAILSPFILTWLQELEDKEIKLGHSKGLLSLHTDSLSMDKLIERLEESNISARLTKEKIGQWFDAFMLTDLTELVADKMGISASDADISDADIVKLEKVLLAYRGKFESLAGGKTFINEDDCLAMIGVIGKCGNAASSMLGIRFNSKLEGMMKKDEELLLSL